MEDCRVLQLGAHPWNFEEHHLQSPPFAMAVLVLLPMIWCFFWPVQPWISSVHVPVSPESCTCSYAVPSVFNISAWGWLRNGLFMLTKTYKNSGWVKKNHRVHLFRIHHLHLVPQFSPRCQRPDLRGGIQLGRSLLVFLHLHLQRHLLAAQWDSRFLNGFRNCGWFRDGLV